MIYLNLINLILFNLIDQAKQTRQYRTEGIKAFYCEDADEFENSKIERFLVYKYNLYFIFQDKFIFMKVPIDYEPQIRTNSYDLSSQPYWADQKMNFNELEENTLGVYFKRNERNFERLFNIYKAHN